MQRRRLDTELVRRGLAPSRQLARELIETGSVLVGGSTADKPARMVADTDQLVVLEPVSPFASRGGEKLDAALGRFEIGVAGRRALDAGASTGGFTDCLLQHGAGHVVAVDVGYGQLHPRLRADHRVTVLERTNVRFVTAEDLGGRFDLVVADLSFISLGLVLPVLVNELSRPGADAVVLAKPQFEAGRREVSKGRGVVRDPAVRRRALAEVASAAADCGASIMEVMASPVLGPAGNAEFLLHLRAPGGGYAPAGLAGRALHQRLDAVVAEAPDAAADGG